MRFSPLDPEMFRMQAGMAMSHLFAGRFGLILGRIIFQAIAELLVRGDHQRRKSCALRSNEAGAGGDRTSAEAGSHVSYLQSRMQDSDPTTGASRPLRDRPASSGATGVISSGCQPFKQGMAR
jgi:hypothetical protein